jgi:HPt (histidine-containing phosphotransfer) domain-containing protein
MHDDSRHQPSPWDSSAAAPPTAPALDHRPLTQLLAELDGDTEVIAELLREYLGDTPRVLHELERAIRDHDLGAIALAAHTLKGTSASVGASLLAARCDEIGRSVRSGAPLDLPTVLTQLRAEFERVRALLVAPQAAPDQRIDVEALLRRIS